MATGSSHAVAKTSADQTSETLAHSASRSTPSIIASNSASTLVFAFILCQMFSSGEYLSAIVLHIKIKSSWS